MSCWCDGKIAGYVLQDHPEPDPANGKIFEPIVYIEAKYCPKCAKPLGSSNQATLCVSEEDGGKVWVETGGGRNYGPAVEVLGTVVYAIDYPIGATLTITEVAR